MNLHAQHRVVLGDDVGVVAELDVGGGARGATRGHFPVKFYLTAMLFIIFDIEIVFLYPWAVHFDALGLFGFAAMALFIVNVSVAYAYEWRRGGLSWE